MEPNPELCKKKSPRSSGAPNSFNYKKSCKFSILSGQTETIPSSRNRHKQSQMQHAELVTHSSPFNVSAAIWMHLIPNNARGTAHASSIATPSMWPRLTGAAQTDPRTSDHSLKLQVEEAKVDRFLRVAFKRPVLRSFLSARSIDGDVTLTFTWHHQHYPRHVTKRRVTSHDTDVVVSHGHVF